MQYQYVVSAHKSSSVVAAVSGSFVSSTEQNLIVARGNRLQVFRQHQDTLELLGEHSVNGQLHHVEFFQPLDRSTGLLLIVSSKQQFAVVSWDVTQRVMVTESTGGFNERTGRSGTRTLVAVDWQSRVFAISAYQGIVHVFPMGKTTTDELLFAVQQEEHGGILVPEYLKSSGSMVMGRGKRGKSREHTARSSDIHGVSALYVDELKMVDMCFCRDAQSPQIAVLYEDADMARRIRVYEVARVRGELQMVPQRSYVVGSSGSRLVAMAGGAVLVLGHSHLSICEMDGSSRSMALGSTDVCDVCWVDERQRERLLLADSSGSLTLVAFGKGANSEPSVSRLGSIPVASAISYIADGCVFIGSHCGDSLLVRLLTQPVLLDPTEQISGVLSRPGGVCENSSYVQPLQSFANLAPIVDLCVVGQGPGQGQKVAGSVVACSGLRNTPALRVVRNGVAIASIAGLEAHGILRVWALTTAETPSISSSGGMDVDSSFPGRRVLVVASMAARTVVLGWTESDGSDDAVEMAELEPCGWITDEPTLAAAAVSDGFAVQATASALLLLDSSGNRVYQWAPEKKPGAISAAAVYGHQVAVAVGSTVFYVEVHGSQLKCVSTCDLPSDVACIDVHAWDVGRPSTHIAVGLWGSDAVGLLSVPDLMPALDLALPGDGGLPRSILQCTLGATRYLLVGLGDGRLHHFALQPSDANRECLSVGEHKCVTLGTHPLSLTPFVNHGSLSVFAASDYSAVLFAAGDGDSRRPARLMYANVDATDIACVAPISGSMAFPDALCLVSLGRLWIGRPDPVQNLHVRTHALPAWAEPNRVAFNQSVYALATIHTIDQDSPALPWGPKALGTNAQDPMQNGKPDEFGRVSILDAQTMDVLASLLLDPFESPLSLCAATLECATGSLRSVFVLGTSVVLPGEDDARKGRVLLLHWDENAKRLSIVGSFATAGSVYAVVGFRGMVLAAVANRLLLLGWQKRRVPPLGSASQVSEHVFVAPDPDHELVAFCSQQTQIASLSLSVAGELIVVGDILASVSLYRYEALPTTFSQGSDSKDEPAVRHRLVPLARDASGVWTTAVSAVPAPLPQNHSLLLPPIIEEEAGGDGGSSAGNRQGIPSYSQAFPGPTCERYLVADAYHNIIRLVCTQSEQQAADGANIQEHRLAVEGRWHLGDQINVIRTGSLVMDIPDPEFPDYFRPLLLFGTLNGAVGVIASVENGKLGRILDRLQINMAHLLPTPGLWSYDRWRAYTSDKRDCESFGFLDGDLIEGFLDLSPETQQLVFSGGGALLLPEKKNQIERLRKMDYWSSFSRVEGEADCRCLAQFSVSDIALRENVSLDFVKRLVESLTRLH
ncbi:hypothetical protein FB639_000949 [Coemansia asiatica]|nr:hypothetical protein FB639_000949 [Coemansia asiatica]